MIDIGDIVFIIMFAPVIGIVLAALIVFAIYRKKVKRMMADERFRNAERFNKTNQQVVISPDGLIGTVDVLNPKIIHIKDIKSFQITFDEERIERDSGGILFDDIISSVQPYLKKQIRDIYLILNLTDNTVVKIQLLRNNTIRFFKSNDIRPNWIIEFKQNEIIQLLSALEEAEKNVKKKRRL